MLSSSAKTKVQQGITKLRNNAINIKCTIPVEMASENYKGFKISVQS